MFRMTTLVSAAAALPFCAQCLAPVHARDRLSPMLEPSSSQWDLDYADEPLPASMRTCCG